MGVSICRILWLSGPLEGVNNGCDAMSSMMPWQAHGIMNGCVKALVWHILVGLISLGSRYVLRFDCASMLNIFLFQFLAINSNFKV